MSTHLRGPFVVLTVVALFASTGCDVSLTQDPQAAQPLPAFVSAAARSNHYVDLRLATNAGPAGKVPFNYTVVAPDGSSLTVLEAEMSEDGRRVLLTTDTQSEVEYQIAPTESLDGVAAVGTTAVPIGSIGFLGSSTREPFVESAVSLTNASVLVSFSEQVDREIAENSGFYTIADPDGNTDVDITVLGAVLDADGRSVVLTTSPQANIAYSITTTNVKSRFSCADGELTLLDNSPKGQPLLCATDARAIVNTSGLVAPFSLTARQDIDPSATLDPDAAGQPGEVTSSTCGVGVDCESNQRDIAGTGADSDQEIAFNLDRPFRADRLILGLNQMDFDN